MKLKATIVHVTMDHEIFTLLPQNRMVKARDKARLMKAIEQRDLLRLFPIIVNSDMQVMEGQHRLACAKELGKPIYYIKDDDVTTADISIVNSNRKAWSGKDYVNFYAAEGSAEFKKLKSLLDTYGMSITAALRLIEKDASSYYAGGAIGRDMRTGKISADNYALAVKIADLCKRLKVTGKCPYAFQPEFMLGIKRVIMKATAGSETCCEKIYGKRHILPLIVEPGESCSHIFKQILDVK